MVWPWKPIRSAGSPSARTASTCRSRQPRLGVEHARVVGLEFGREVEQPAQVGAQPLVIGQGERGADPPDPLAVGLEIGRVHAVQRRAAHQPYGPQHSSPSGADFAFTRVPC